MYHVLDVFANASDMTVFDRVAFHCQKMAKGNYGRAVRPRKVWQSVSVNLIKSCVVAEHQINRRIFRGFGLELHEVGRFVEQGIFQAKHKSTPLLSICTPDNEIQISSGTVVTVELHCMPSRQ